MIYKATPITAHRVEISTPADRFIPTNDLGHRLLDLRVLSHFSEDQSTMYQYPDASQFSSSRNLSAPYTHFLTPPQEQVPPAAHRPGPSVALPSSRSGYEPPYTLHDMMPAGAFEETTKAYEVSNAEARYDSFGGTLPSTSAYFHPPMLVPSHYSSPPAASPIPSISPGPSPRKPELQIRLSQPCYEMGQRHHEILPLETGPFKK